MKTRTFLLAALALALLPVSARQSLPDSSTPAWIQEFNNLPETTRKSYIAQFRKAEQLFAQKRIMECLFSLMELEKLYAGNPGLCNFRGACYIPFKDNPGMTPLLQFKRYICARKLDNQPLAAELEKLYGPMDDTPYYYCTQAILKLMEGDKEAAQEQLLSAIRIYGGTSAIQAFTDAMTEAGILPSPYGQTVPTEQPVKTGLEKRR